MTTGEAVRNQGAVCTCNWYMFADDPRCRVHPDGPVADGPVAAPGGPPAGRQDGPAPGAPDREERPATGHTRTRRSDREWRDGILIINFTTSQRRDGNILVMGDDGRVYDYDTGELVLATGRKKSG